MTRQGRFTSLAVAGLVLLSIAATRFAARRSPAAASRAPTAMAVPAACTLLTAAEASTAIQASSRPGKQFMDVTGCMWSNDPEASDSSRRVALVTHSQLSFRIAMRPAITTIKVEPVSGIGDEAFYQIYPRGENVFIWVRKGTAAFSINILTRMDPRPFTDDQEKAKEAVLAKAAVGRL